MPRFRLHIHDRRGFSCGEERLDLAGLHVALGYALDGIRSMAGEELHSGVLSPIGRMEIADEAGGIVDVIRYIDAIEVRLPENGR
jgi:hypothetical protein